MWLPWNMRVSPLGGGAGRLLRRQPRCMAGCLRPECCRAIESGRWSCRQGRHSVTAGYLLCGKPPPPPRRLSAHVLRHLRLVSWVWFSPSVYR